MKAVYTQEELASAINNGEKHILAKGSIAETLQSKNRRKTVAKVGGIALALGGILAAPFTGGTSLLGLGAAGLTVGTLSITTAELAIICGTSIALYGIHKNRQVKMKYNGDGSVEIDVE